MEARLVRPLRTIIGFVAIGFVALLALSADTHAAGYRTTNFTVSAPTPQLAKEIGDAAEQWRKTLSIEWIGAEMPNWNTPCPIHAQVKPNMGAGGATSFMFDRGEVFGWRMNIQGSRERILDSVLPHEVTHTIFACYFRQPLPRWADEGACTTVEHPSEIAKQERMLIKFLKERRGISFSQMFAMKEYPKDVMPLYSQGHSLAQMLIELRGKQVFLEFLADGMGDENWPRAVRKFYKHENLFVLQENWLNWVKAGRPSLGPESAIQVASANMRNGRTPSRRDSTPIYRGQSPDHPVPIAITKPSSNRTADSVYARIAAKSNRKGVIRR